MSPNVDTRPTVLIVEDEPDVADAHALKLRDRYETRVAYGGKEALEQFGDDIDAVLLDRRMPGLHGDEVLERIRDRGFDGPVIMTTAVDPDLNILEMDFDDYLCKPILSDTLATTLEQHIESRNVADPQLEEFFRIVSKLDVLESKLSASELERSDEYQSLKHRAEELGSELDDSVNDFGELVSTYQDINRGSTS
ncbi:response regulator [Haloarculaceae archaeon H-GB2-1]|nr:response regulator [Haloarculaceae archaeon H-GB1-1]MEA5389103.1 response regulator [Haloarculaceae archaeon H-GB11]MEA5407164.1 response regulator [Haloarculaceae archaeon H-GB2-1]